MKVVEEFRDKPARTERWLVTEEEAKNLKDSIGPVSSLVIRDLDSLPRELQEVLLTLYKTNESHVEYHT
jgi:hypothetical protein